jgi:SAM-dependent methyltransferase
VYSADLAYVHDAAFGDLARRAAPEIVRLLRDRDVRSGHIVEVGCGSGIAARRFVADGYTVTGIDVSPAMIRLARAKVPEARFRVATIERLRLPACDAVVAVGEIVSYVPGGLRALQRFFRRVHDALRPGGVLLFDFIESAAGRTFAAKSFRGADWALAARATFEPSRKLLTRRIAVVRTIGRRARHASEIHRVRVYSRAELRRALERVGLSAAISRSYGAYRLMTGDAAVIATRPATGGNIV